MCIDATDAAQMNTGLNSVLVFILLLRHIVKAICTMKSSRHLVVLRKKNSPLKFYYARDNPGPSAIDEALGRTLPRAVCQREYGVFGSTERHRVLTLDNKPTKVEMKEALEYRHLEKRAARVVVLCLR